MFLAFEGIAGAGKSTQARLLVPYLQETTGASVLVSAAFEGKRRGQAVAFLDAAGIMPDTHGRMFLFQALHCAQYQETLSALNRGDHVIADRWRASFYAHHIYHDTFNDDTLLMDRLDGLAFRSLNPIQTIFFALSPEVAYSRYIAREANYGGETLALESLEYFRATSSYYERLADQSEWTTVDASQSVDAVHDAIVSAISQLI